MRYKLSNSIYINIFGISLSLLFVGCSGFQNASYYSDGIYGNVTKVSIQRERTSPKANAYSQYFDEKAKEYTWETSPEDAYLTNVDSLNTQQPLAQQQSRSAWGGGNKTTEIYIVDNRLDFGLFPFNVNSFYGYNYGFNPFWDFYDPFYNPYWGGFGWNFPSPFYRPFYGGFYRGFYQPFYGYGYAGFYSPFNDPFRRQPYWNRNRRFRRNVNAPRRAYAQNYRGERSYARSPRARNNVQANARANERTHSNSSGTVVNNVLSPGVRANGSTRIVNGETLEVPNLVRESRTVTARRNIDNQRGQYTGSQNNTRRLNGEGGRSYAPAVRSNTRRASNSGTSRQSQSVRTPRRNDNNSSSNNRTYSAPRRSSPAPSRSYSTPARSSSRSSGSASRSSRSGRRQ